MLFQKVPLTLDRLTHPSPSPVSLQHLIENAFDDLVPSPVFLAAEPPKAVLPLSSAVEPAKAFELVGRWGLVSSPLLREALGTDGDRCVSKQTSSFLFLVVRPGAPSSVPCS